MYFENFVYKTESQDDVIEIRMSISQNWIPLKMADLLPKRQLE